MSEAYEIPDDLQRMQNEIDRLRAQLATARADALEEVAKWHEEKGWLLDEDDVAAAIRALKNVPDA